MKRFAWLACTGVVAFHLVGAGRPTVRAESSHAIQQPTFKSGTALVEVDAVILDKAGKFVPGLQASDLEIFEDGRPQKIQQFYLVTHERGARAELANTPEVSQAEKGSYRVFVMMFDEAHLANESLLRAKRGGEDFIRDQMAAGDVGGIFVNGAMFKGRLTTDKQELIAGVHAVAPAFENRQALLATFRAFPRIPSEVDAARIADGARTLVEELGVKACREDPGDCEVAGGLQQVENLIQQKARLYTRQARIMTDRTMQSLHTVGRGLSRIPGRKTVVFISEGFFVEESRSALEMVAAEAARGGTTIYSIDARGLINSMSANPDAVRRERSRTTLFDTGEDGPYILAANTGGFIVRNIDDMSRAFGLIVRDTSTYYVIGYQPVNTTMDGKVRKIEVRAKVPDLEVRARKGYVAVALPPQAAMWGGKD
jgi:VWFA-related protein